MVALKWPGCVSFETEPISQCEVQVPLGIQSDECISLLQVHLGNLTLSTSCNSFFQTQALSILCWQHAAPPRVNAGETTGNAVKPVYKCVHWYCIFRFTSEKEGIQEQIVLCHNCIGSGAFPKEPCQKNPPLNAQEHASTMSEQKG